MPVLAAVDHCTNLFLDVHLMIADPIRYVKQFVDAGADLVTFHIESNSDPAATIAAIHDAGAKAGIVLKPGTPWEEAIPYLAQVEVVLVMTVEPGFGGQSFLWDMVEKVKALPNVKFVKGKVADAVQAEGNRVRITAEDAVRGEKMTLDYDLVVLATGMQPSLAGENAPLPLPLDEDGFIAGGEEAGIFAAGCARMPLDVMRSAQSGTAAALKAVQTVKGR